MHFKGETLEKDVEERKVDGSEMMEEHEINCDAVEDTIQERNTFMYVRPSEQSRK